MDTMRKFAGLVGTALVILAITAGALVAQDSGSSAPATTAWLGVAVSEQDDQVVIVRVQAGSPANAAGLLIGDVIVTFNGETVASASDLVAKVRTAAPGDTVALEVLRHGVSRTLEVTLGSAPPAGRLGRAIITQDPLSWAQRLLHADLKAVDDGFEVVNVLVSFNPFDLQVGDIVTAINGQPVAELTPQTLAESMMKAGSPVLKVTVKRAGEEVTLESDFPGIGMHLRLFPGFDLDFDFRRGFGRGDFGPRGGQMMPRGFFFGLPDPQTPPDDNTQNSMPVVPTGESA